MKQRIKEIFHDTRAVFRTRWVASELVIPPWVIHAVIYLTILRSFSYGVELLVLVTNNPISPLMAFAAIFGIQLWGALMLIGLAIFLTGILTKRSVIVTVGSLICAAVWFSFSICLGFGWWNLGTGGRFFIASCATATTWLIFFIVQLKTIKRMGVGND